MHSERRGHRSLPHTADVIVEAWAPDLEGCCEEAVAGLISLFVDASGAEIAGTHAARFDIEPAEACLLAVLEEVLFLVDTAAAVPIGVRVQRSDRIDATYDLAAADTVESVGSVPKAISRSELEVEVTPGGVRCRFLVDV